MKYDSKVFEVNSKIDLGDLGGLKTILEFLNEVNGNIHKIIRRLYEW